MAEEYEENKEMNAEYYKENKELNEEIYDLNSLIMNHETMIELYPEDTALKVAMKQLFDRRDVLIREFQASKQNEYKRTWPAECAGCLYRKREYIDEISDYVECIHPIFSRQSYQCPVRMTAWAKKKFGRSPLDDYI